MREHAGRLALWLAILTATAPLLSIAAASILAVLTLLLTLYAVRPLRYPPILLPLALFVLGTFIAWLASDNMEQGFAQIKKLWIWLLPLAFLSTLRTATHVRRVLIAWAMAAGVSSGISVYQFIRSYQKSMSMTGDFYRDYVANRTTGAMSHWMTFSGEQMIVIAMLGAAVLFGRDKRRWWFLIALALLGAAVLLNQTRSVWLGIFVAGVYLLGAFRWKLLPLVPVAAVVVFLLAPASVRHRLETIYRPDPKLDSNQHRVVTFQTGVRMIQANPLFGLGPERIGPEFDKYMLPGTVKPDGFYGHLHNIYLQYAAERGIPTLLALLALLGKILYDFFQRVRHTRDPEIRSTLHGCLAAVLAVLTAGFFEHNLGDSEVLMLFLAVVSLGYAARDWSALPGKETAAVT